MRNGSFLWEKRPGSGVDPPPHVRAWHVCLFVCFWRNSPQWARTSSFTRFLDHTQRRTTGGRTPLDEWSARRRDLYLTTHNTHNRQTSTPAVGFEPTISAGERPQTYALDRAANGTGVSIACNRVNCTDFVNYELFSSTTLLYPRYLASASNSSPSYEYGYMSFRDLALFPKYEKTSSSR